MEWQCYGNLSRRASKSVNYVSVWREIAGRGPRRFLLALLPESEMRFGLIGLVPACAGAERLQQQPSRFRVTALWPVPGFP